ncbi:ImmA/IrrE family metallo-endopeptidase [Tetragenococcus koreensis]|uniref:ImmA/IrrE family metallo-endopeptidase n=1 Tax=Tetragenococcus koreensis TaxID=290335 RepID=UPI000F4E0778|nr:ImmA/IrrE family metallo-endopeptidase [Tetragenococcus koreensis]AYW44604.1 toxin [Tetragenococcus koreensis]GEN90633.1 toxin [Tetragenococcus koreensis]
MDKAEGLMSLFSNLSYVYDDNMPKKQGGLNVDNYIYLNPNQTKTELTSTVSEEIGHYLTSAGDIIAQDTNEKRKQERKARDVGATLVVTADDILKCFDNGCETTQDCVDFLNVTSKTFNDAIEYYRRKYGGILTENNDILIFNADGTISVHKRKLNS